MLGTAIGCIGLSLEEFSQLYFEEFESVCRAWQEMYDAQERGAWERTRVLASICIQPHVRKKITPRQILPLPWDRGQHKTISHEPEMINVIFFSLSLRWLDFPKCSCKSNQSHPCRYNNKCYK